MKKKTIKRKLFFYVKFVRGIMPVVSCTYICIMIIPIMYSYRYMIYTCCNTRASAYNILYAHIYL